MRLKQKKTLTLNRYVLCNCVTLTIGSCSAFAIFIVSMVKWNKRQVAVCSSNLKCTPNNEKRTWNTCDIVMEHEFHRKTIFHWMNVRTSSCVISSPIFTFFFLASIQCVCLFFPHYFPKQKVECNSMYIMSMIHTVFQKHHCSKCLMHKYSRRSVNQ